jgi:RNA polymerase sigma-70 factor (ECF subfamily)
VTGDTDELVAGAQAGDDAAYEALFARVADRLLLYLRLRMGTQLGANLEPLDLLQDTYLAAHQAFATFETREPGAFGRWLFRIADNRLRDAAKRLHAEKRRAFEGAARGSGVLERLRAEQASPSSESGQRERARALNEALAQLPEPEREAVLLRHFHQQTHEAIAAQLSVSEPTARRLVARAQAKLGRALRELSA